MNALFWEISGAAPHVQFASCTFKLHKVDVDAKGEKFSMPLTPGGCSNATLGRKVKPESEQGINPPLFIS